MISGGPAVTYRSLFRLAASAALAMAIPLMGAGPAWAAKGPHSGGGGGGSSTPTGIDVSYPQCGDSLPAGEAFAIVGLNGGLANDYNACLASEFTYAQGSTGLTKQAKAQLYLNTADPGNGVADWPSPAQLGAYGSATTPSDGTCSYASGTSGPGANSNACAYIYGYDMVRGITYTASNGSSQSIAGDAPTFATATGQQLYGFPTWLDVETANSWQSGSAGLAMNIADLQGMVDAVRAAATSGGAIAAQLGIYSTSSQWGQITGPPTNSTAGGNLWGLPDWIPGARGESGAVSNCSLASFTDGSVPITQWFGHPYDGDYSCIG